METVVKFDRHLIIAAKQYYSEMIGLTCPASAVAEKQRQD